LYEVITLNNKNAQPVENRFMG